MRPQTRGEVESLGARFLELTSVSSAAGEGGYARVLSAEEQQALQEELNAHIAAHDVVITTAQVPGRRPPVLVRAAAIEKMAAGAVVIDMAASALGGNVEGSRPDETFVTDGGVTVIGAPNLASAMATGSSAAYAQNLAALLGVLVVDGALHIDLDDEIQRAVVITHGGSVVQPATLEVLAARRRLEDDERGGAGA